MICCYLFTVKVLTLWHYLKLGWMILYLIWRFALLIMIWVLLEETKSIEEVVLLYIIFSNCVHYRTCSDLSEGSVESLWVELFPIASMLFWCAVLTGHLKLSFFDNLMIECEKGLLTYWVTSIPTLHLNKLNPIPSS